MSGNEYITGNELKILMQDLINKLNEGDIEQVKMDVNQVLSDTSSENRYIDHTYITKVRDQRRLTKIAEIASMLNEMSSEQVDNVHVYVVNEYNEPNHEAVALEAIIKLSREQRKK